MIISFLSGKGGVGKTVSCVNLGYSLSIGKHKKKILLIDLDCQAGLTQHVTDKFNSKFKATITDVLIGKVKIEDSIHSYNENLDIIPASYQFNEIASTDFTESFRKSLCEMKKKYDFILLDLSPTIYPGTQIPVSLSDYIIIPVACMGSLSLKGIQVVGKVVVEMRKEKNPNLDVLGILPTFIDRTQVSKQMMKYLKENYREDLFPSIRRSTYVSQAASLGQTVFEYKKAKTGIDDYSDFSKEFLRRIKKGENK